MNAGNVISLVAAKQRRAAQSLGLDYDRMAEPSEVEQVALHLFNVVAQALENGAQPDDVNKLIERMDLVISALAH